jgi:hypothetical protein
VPQRPPLRLLVVLLAGAQLQPQALSTGSMLCGVCWAGPGALACTVQGVQQQHVTRRRSFWVGFFLFCATVRGVLRVPQC